MKLTEEQVSYLREHYHDTPDQELADALGISIFTVRSRRTRHGWRKDAAYIRKINQDRAQRYRNWEHLNTPECHAKGIETRNKIYETEMMRIRWGLPQLTKRHFKTELREKQLQRNYLKRLGYVIDDVKLIAYYKPDTHRARRLEAVGRGKRKGTIKPYYDFLPWGKG